MGSLLLSVLKLSCFHLFEHSWLSFSVCLQYNKLFSVNCLVTHWLLIPKWHTVMVLFTFSKCKLWWTHHVKCSGLHSTKVNEIPANANVYAWQMANVMWRPHRTARHIFGVPQTVRFLTVPPTLSSGLLASGLAPPQNLLTFTVNYFHYMLPLWTTTHLKMYW